MNMTKLFNKPQTVIFKMNETQKRCPDSSDLYQNCGSTPEMVPEYADSVAEL